VFEKIISSCNDAGNKVLTVHSRRAEKEVISIIGQAFSGKVILHWYSGGLKEIEQAIVNGFYFSINYAMTQSENGRKIIDHIPIERILLETDGPFIKVNHRPSTPLVVNLILNKVAIIKQQTKMLIHINQNLRKILS
jgi:TatD DNase family protein